MTDLLHRLARNGDISWLSFYFAELVANRSDTAIDDLPGISAALVSEANLAGNACIELERFNGRPLFRSNRISSDEMPRGPDSADWNTSLAANPCYGDPAANQPLVLEAGRLYLNRLWRYEDYIANRIQALQAAPTAVDSDELAASVDSMFSTTDSADPDQKNAVLSAASRPFSVISGGPGSGKTSTVVRILAVLLTRNPACRIALAAPTGKAAARMMDSIRERIDHLKIEPTVRQSMPTEARTIHRLLHYRHRQFDYNEQHPLPFDCVVVDEASMIDLELMYHLLTALAPGARLILLGDRDQLASVAAGNVLGDITGHGHRLDSSAPPTADSISILGSNYRFARDSAIGELATRVNRQQVDAAMALLRENTRGLHWYEPAQDSLDPDALSWLLDAYQPIFDSETPNAALAVFEATRVLTATNYGPTGVHALNGFISQALLTRNELPDSDLYHGLPIMITRNQYESELYNGDIGIIWRFAEGLRACFRDAAGKVRVLAINRLPEHVPAWASTVHKSQGSEYDSVLLILPADPESEALSRELLYTAITRARQRFLLHAVEGAIMRAIGELTRRHSGLAVKLGWPG